jgi:hypothetical protein
MMLQRAKISRVIFGSYCRHARAYSDAVIFLSYFLFVWLVVKPAVIYYNPEGYIYQPSYPTAALLDCCKTWSASLVSFYPGEFVDYCGATLGHFFAFSWLGALIITVLAWLSSFFTGRYLLKTGGSALSVARYFPAIVILAQYLRYDPSASDIISVVIALMSAAAYIAYGSQKRSRRYLLFILLSVIVAVASKAAALFFVLCALHEIARRKSPLSALLQLACCAACLLFSALIIGDFLRVLPAWPRPGEGPWTVTLRALLYASVFLAVVTDALSRLPRRFFAKTNSAAAGFPGRLAPALVAFAAVGFFLFSASAPLARNHLLLNYYLYTQQWDRLLTEAASRPFAAFTDFHSHIVDRALFHRGRLLDDMLRFPQSRNCLFLNNVPSDDPYGQLRRCIWAGWTLYEIGVLNNSENICYEALAALSHYPEGLRLLALIHMAKGMPEAAKTCLYALRKDFVYRRMADDYLHRIEKDSSLSNDREIGWTRSIMLKNDGIDGFFLMPLLERNAQNKMAFEYMIASYLLSGDIEALADATRFLPAFHYAKIPRLYEEALVINERVFGRRNDLHGMTIRPEAFDRFIAFSEIVENRYNGRVEDAKNELRARFGDSFFFYYLYGPAGRKGKP